jgi:hypothetical protein
MSNYEDQLNIVHTAIVNHVAAQTGRFDPRLLDDRDIEQLGRVMLGDEPGDGIDFAAVADAAEELVKKKLTRSSPDLVDRQQSRPTPIDGTVLLYEVRPDEGLVYATLADQLDGPPLIVAFDRDDLAALDRARQEFQRATTEPLADADTF